MTTRQQRCILDSSLKSMLFKKQIALIPSFSQLIYEANRRRSTVWSGVRKTAKAFLRAGARGRTDRKRFCPTLGSGPGRTPAVSKNKCNAEFSNGRAGLPGIRNRDPLRQHRVRKARFG